MRIVKDGRFYGQSGRMRFGQPWVGAYLYAVESVRTPATILGWSAAKDETKVCLCLKTSCVYGADDMSVSLRYEDGLDNVFVVIPPLSSKPGRVMDWMSKTKSMMLLNYMRMIIVVAFNELCAGITVEKVLEPRAL